MSILDSLHNLINYTFIRYKGCIIERRGNIFIVFGQPYVSLENAKVAIDKSFDYFKKSIK